MDTTQPLGSDLEFPILKADISPPTDAIAPPASPEQDGVWHYARQDLDRETTRYLAAATQLDIDYALRVARSIVGEPLRALAPAYGADIAVVTRWAVDSVQRRTRRDRWLAVAPAVGLVVGILLAWSGMSWLFFVSGAIVAVFMVAWVIVSMEQWVREYRIVSSQMLRGVFDLTKAPEPRQRWISDRIDAAAARRRGNLVVFQGEGAFVGSGKSLSKHHVVIDVSHGRVKGGKLRKPKRFSNADIHAALMTAMRNIGLPEIKVEERLFVNGLHIRGNNIFLPDGETRPPAASVDPSILGQATLHPTPDARVYVCVEMPAWQGQLVVTLFFRALHAGGLLYIEWEHYVLRPLHSNFLNIDKRYGVSKIRQITRAYAGGIKCTPSALAAAPLVVAADFMRWRAARRQLDSQKAAISRGQEFDYGARRSIRETAGGIQHRHHFLARDETMYVLMSQQILEREVRNFLKQRDVSLGEFDTQVEEINKVTFKYFNVQVGDIKDSSVSIGTNVRSRRGPRPKPG